MKFKKNYILYIMLIIIFLDFFERFPRLIMQNENGVDIGAVCAVPNICLSIFMIFYVEKFQHLFYYYKTRLVKNNQVYLKSFIGILKNSIFKFLLFILMYTIFFFITNKQVLLVYVLIYLFSLYIELLIIRNILIFFFKPRIISLILLVFFFMTWTINNFFPNNPLIPIVASFSPYSMFPFSLLKIRIIVYLVISILMYFVLTYLRQITKFIKKFNFNIFKLLVILSFFLLAFNIYTIGRIKDMEFYLFYSHELYQNLYEYMMFNFIIYFTINLKTGLFCFNMKSGMQRYFQYRIISRKKFKYKILLKFYKMLLITSLVLTVIVLLTVFADIYNASIMTIMMTIIRLILIFSISNHILLVVNKALDERIMIGLVLITLLCLFMSTLNVFIIGAVQLVLLGIIIYRKELI